jgi:hypothetical protein
MAKTVTDLDPSNYAAHIVSSHADRSCRAAPRHVPPLLSKGVCNESRKHHPLERRIAQFVEISAVNPKTVAETDAGRRQLLDLSSIVSATVLVCVACRVAKILSRLPTRRET